MDAFCKFILGFLVLGIFSCGQKYSGQQIRVIAKAYYQVYQERSDFDKFLEFYDEQVILEDINNGERIVGKAALAKFFDWENSNFEKLEAKNLIIEEQVAEGLKVVTKGYFTPFLWGELEVPAMYFMSQLTFNVSGKIIKQIDWINYPESLMGSVKRGVANEWIGRNKN